MFNYLINQIINIFIFHLLLKNIFVFSFSQSSVDLIRNIGPPLNNIRERDNSKGPENGIRQITKDECKNTVSNWFKSSNIASGSNEIEKLELLMILDRFHQVMPGLKTNRIELIAFGLFIDGYIEAIAGIIWTKLNLPNEMEVISIYEQISTKLTKKNKRIQVGELTMSSHIENLLQFIDTICQENAILPEYSSLYKYDIYKPVLDSFYDKKRIKKENDALTIIQEEIIRKYIEINKAKFLCLDSNIIQSMPIINLGHYWYRSYINHNDVKIPFYFRQKKGREFEYEVVFTKPEAGTVIGSGTVGGPLIVPVDDSTAIQLPRDITTNDLKMLADVIKTKIINPI